MKQPYFQERSLPYKVKEYMEKNKNVDVEDMTDYIMRNNREFCKKNRKNFVKSVQKAYEWELYVNRCELSDSEDIMDDDGGGPDILEVIEPEPPAKAPSLNSMMSKMYKSKSSTPKSKNSNDESFYLDTEGDPSFNGSSPIKSTKKKRKNKDDEIEEIIKKKKRKQVLPEESKVTFADMAGIEPLKDKICDLLTSLKWPGVMKPQHKSVLLTGPSGSGKTTFAAALAGTLKVPIMKVTSTELVGGVSGESESRIKETFDQKLFLSSVALLIEKIEVIAPKEGATKSMEKRIGAQLSSCLTDMKTRYLDKQVLVLAETSRPEHLDWDLRSSFDEEIFMAIPSEAARVHILKLLCTDITLEGGDFEELGRHTPGFVAGDLMKLAEKVNSFIFFFKLKKNNVVANATAHTASLPRTATLLGNLENAGILKPNREKNLSLKTAFPMVQPVLKREGFPTVPDVTWDDIGGLESVKGELREKILEPIQFAKLHEEFGADRPNGILMWGPPGCGKTLLAKAVANQAAVNLLPVMGPELLNMYQGESERAVREVFQRARNVSPCVIFFDEFDSLCPVRSKGAEVGSKTTIVNTLLTEMNGFSKRDDVYVIAATNRPDILDPAVTRPGRFDTMLFVDVPDHEGRVSILKARTKNGSCPLLAPDVDLQEISHHCLEFSGADLDQLVYLASKEAIREIINNQTDAKESMKSSSLTIDSDNEVTRRQVHRRHFGLALKKIKPSISLEEQKRYKKLYQKLEASRSRPDLAAFSDDVINQTTEETREMEV
ncbi:unnamed protein product, partial [Meganyctiphanes norvegica]